MSTDDIIRNIGGALSLFAGRVEDILRRETNSDENENETLILIDKLMSFFPMDKVNLNAGTYDQYLFDLQKTVLDNYRCGNYQVAYFHAHLIFMSYVYYSIELAYSIWPVRVKDQYDLLNAYSTHNKPSIQDHSSTYSFSKIPEKEIFKVFYSIGLDVQFIQQLSSYVDKRNDYAHATGEGNIDAETFMNYVSTIESNMERLFALFAPHLKDIYIKLLLDSCPLTYSEAESKIGDYILDGAFSVKDIEYLCNLGLSNIRNENAEFRDNYRHVKKVHCAFIEYCIENFGIETPPGFSALRDEAYLYYRYKGKASDYVENELGISAYECGKEGGEFPVYSCPECGEEQLVYDADTHRFHCFACDQNYTEEDLTFCERCGSLMRRKEKRTICQSCIQNMTED